MSYKVVGKQRVLGVDPGGVITTPLPPAYAAHLVAKGHLVEVVPESPAVVEPPVVADEPAATQEAPVVAADLPKEGD